MVSVPESSESDFPPGSRRPNTIKPKQMMMISIVDLLWWVGWPWFLLWCCISLAMVNSDQKIRCVRSDDDESREKSLEPRVSVWPRLPSAVVVLSVYSGLLLILLTSKIWQAAQLCAWFWIPANSPGLKNQTAKKTWSSLLYTKWIPWLPLCFWQHWFSIFTTLRGIW